MTKTTHEIKLQPTWRCDVAAIVDPNHEVCVSEPSNVITLLRNDGTLPHVSKLLDHVDKCDVPRNLIELTKSMIHATAFLLLDEHNESRIMVSVNDDGHIVIDTMAYVFAIDRDIKPEQPFVCFRNVTDMTEREM